MNSWLFVIGDCRALDWVVANGTMAFRDHIRASRISTGDRFALYTTRGCYRNPTRDRAEIIAIGTVSGGVHRATVTIGDELFNQSVTFELDSPPLGRRSGLPFAPLVPDLEFIKKKSGWMAYVRKALVAIPDGDLRRIEREMHELRR